MSDIQKHYYKKTDPIGFTAPYRSSYKNYRTGKVFIQKKYPRGDKWELEFVSGAEELNELNDVTLTNLQDGDTMIWDSVTNQFVNKEFKLEVLNNLFVVPRNVPQPTPSGGLRSRFDKPFFDLSEALTQSQNGDTIHVYPGTYLASTNLHKHGVKWNFIGEPFIQLTGNGGWYDNNQTTSIVITGDALVRSYGSTSILRIDNINTKINVSFNEIIGRGNRVLALHNGSGIINVSKTISCVTVNHTISLEGNASYTINTDIIRNTSSAGISPCIYFQNFEGKTIVNARIIENGLNNATSTIVSQTNPQNGTLIVNVSDEIRSLNLSPYNFWKKTIMHISGNMIINGNVDGVNTVAISISYAPWVSKTLIHNGNAYNNGLSPVVENIVGNSELSLNGTYESNSDNIILLSGSNKTIVNGVIRNNGSSGIQRSGIKQTSANTVVINLLKIVFSNLDALCFGLLGTNASNVKIIHNASSNADTQNISNTIVGTNYVYDTNIE